MGRSEGFVIKNQLERKDDNQTQYHNQNNRMVAKSQGTLELVSNHRSSAYSIRIFCSRSKIGPITAISVPSFQKWKDCRDTSVNFAGTSGYF